MKKIKFDINYSEYIETSGLKDFLRDCNLLPPNLNFDKVMHPPNFSVDPSNIEPFPPEWDDLIRLHWLITSYRITTVMEFGIGYSSLVMAHALSKNYERYHNFVKENLRRNNAFQLWCVDPHAGYISESLNRIPDRLKKHVSTICSSVTMGTFQDRICTYYNEIPNICADFIYLDGPDQFAGAVEDVRGVSTRHPDRLPMAADILSIEWFLVPGTIILVDGRTANARFLAKNLQRNWIFHHYPDLDISVFQLDENPLGVYSAKHMNFMYGN